MLQRPFLRYWGLFFFSIEFLKPVLHLRFQTAPSDEGEGGRVGEGRRKALGCFYLIIESVLLWPGKDIVPSLQGIKLRQREVTCPSQRTVRKQSWDFNRRGNCLNGSHMADREYWYPLELFLLEYLKSFFPLLNNPFWIRALCVHSNKSNGTATVVIKSKSSPSSYPSHLPNPTWEKQLKKIVCLSSSLLSNSTSLANLFFFLFLGLSSLYNVNSKIWKMGNRLT